jgi:thiamine-monophosphate kinase
MSLLGGDTTSTPGPLTVSVAAFGTPLGVRVPARADAKAGEDIWLVGGEIGSAWLGLQLRTGCMSLSELKCGRDEDAARAQSQEMAAHMPAYLALPGEDFDAEAGWLMSTYLAPFVRPECADIVARYASASMDVSDGLILDAGKIAVASNVALRIEANEIPFSIPAMRWMQLGGDFRKLVTGGDDYVVLFTAPPEQRASLEAIDSADALRLTRIGRVEAGEGVRIVDRSGAAIPIPVGGFEHKLGR